MKYQKNIKFEEKKHIIIKYTFYLHEIFMEEFKNKLSILGSYIILP
jgi:hypothetical protein